MIIRTSFQEIVMSHDNPTLIKAVIPILLHYDSHQPKTILTPAKISCRSHLQTKVHKQLMQIRRTTSVHAESAQNATASVCLSLGGPTQGRQPSFRGSVTRLNSRISMIVKGIRCATVSRTGGLS
jgi:hypothetical protein